MLLCLLHNMVGLITSSHCNMFCRGPCAEPGQALYFILHTGDSVESKGQGVNCILGGNHGMIHTSRSSSLRYISSNTVSHTVTMSDMFLYEHTHTLVCFNLVPNAQSCCWKNLPEQQICSNHS